MLKHRESAFPRLCAAVLAVAMAGLATPCVSFANPCSTPDPNDKVLNKGFELNTNGWGAYVGTIQRSQQVPASCELWSLKVTGPNSLAEYGINDSPNWVRRVPAAGTQYRIHASVRAEDFNAPNDANRVNGDFSSCRIRVREYVGTRRVGDRAYSEVIVLSIPDWQRFTFIYTARTQGSTLDVQILCTPGYPGSSFYVDDVAIIELPPPVQGVADPLALVGSGATEAEFSAVLSPNPLRQSGVVDFVTTRMGPVQVQVFDLRGRLVRNVVDQAFAAAGRHTAPLDGFDDRGARITPGMYYYRVRAAEGALTGRFVVLP